MFIPCVSDHYSRCTHAPFVASQPFAGILSLSRTEVAETGRWCKKSEGGECLYDICSVVEAGDVGALVLAKDTEPITIDMPLLAPYLSPILTFLPFLGEWGK